MSALPPVTAIVLSWNRRARTLACLDALARAAYPALDVLVVDNGSSDGSAAAVRAAHPRAAVIENGDNLGFAAGNNVGLARARADGAAYAWLLNDDATAAPDALSRLVAAGEADAHAGMLGPTVYFADRPAVVWSAGGAIDWRAGRTRMLGLEEVDRGQFGTVARPVDFVTGCGLLVKLATVAAVGPFDERFFAYYEETEWCVRAARAGYRSLHVPSAAVWHAFTPAARAASPFVHYYMTRNRLLFLAATGASWGAWVRTLGLDYARTLVSWSVRPKWRHLRPQRNAAARAVADYFRGRFGRAALPAAWGSAPPVER